MVQIGKQVVSYFPDSPAEPTGSEEMTPAQLDRAHAYAHESLTDERMTFLDLILDASAETWTERVKEVSDGLSGEFDPEKFFEAAHWLFTRSDQDEEDDGDAVLAGTPTEWRAGTVSVPEFPEAEARQTEAQELEKRVMAFLTRIVDESAE